MHSKSFYLFALSASAAITSAHPSLVRRVVTELNQAATEEAHQRDDTATRAFSSVTITTGDGKCLFIDELSGDFRANLLPIQVKDCDGSDGEKFDVITAGKHNDQPGTMLIVSALTQGCFNFDPRRAAGDQVNIFSCGGRAAGEGTVTNSQLFAFGTVTAGPLSFQPQNEQGTCLTSSGARLNPAPCDAADPTQQFTFGGAAAGGNTGADPAGGNTETDPADGNTDTDTDTDADTDTGNDDDTGAEPTLDPSNTIDLPTPVETTDAPIATAIQPPSNATATLNGTATLTLPDGFATIAPPDSTDVADVDPTATADPIATEVPDATDAAPTATATAAPTRGAGNGNDVDVADAEVLATATATAMARTDAAKWQESPEFYIKFINTFRENSVFSTLRESWRVRGIMEERFRKTTGLICNIYGISPGELIRLLEQHVQAGSFLREDIDEPSNVQAQAQASVVSDAPIQIPGLTLAAVDWSMPPKLPEPALEVPEQGALDLGSLLSSAGGGGGASPFEFDFDFGFGFANTGEDATASEPTAPKQPETAPAKMDIDASLEFEEDARAAMEAFRSEDDALLEFSDLFN
ncbi:hypothetical protein Dda_7376 [Drechslerella dactyloides]|uniref:Ricin B lectin domain-containing protein n=1 Tax=Drechslerella dactyloides TaxID=74499 RepID=A0AAD6NFI7_DREDA|nr:hypothetical protein Dda_7376 [Drechslerella dactyloides]